MDIEGLKLSLANYLNQLSHSIQEWLGSLDQETLRLTLICGIAMLAFFLFLGFVAIVISMARRREQPVEEPMQSSAESSVILRDMNNRISALASQAKDEQLYLRQEIAELKQIITSGVHAEGLQRQIEELTSRLASYSALMREEYHAARSEVSAPKITKPATQMVGRVNAREVFAQSK